MLTNAYRVRKMMLSSFILLGAVFLMAAGDSQVPDEVKENPEFFVKMNMIENISTLESLQDEDLEIAINSKAFTDLSKTKVFDNDVRPNFVTGN